MRKIFTAVALGLTTLAASAQWALPANDVPAYHAAAPAKGAVLAPVLSGTQLTGDNFRYPWQVTAYRDAARVQRVIYQLPCYCHCDKAMGHESLRSCFEGLHGAECTTCSKEAIYAYAMTEQGKSVAEIRDGIMRGEFQKIDLNDVQNGM
jgi:hypothetical protein